MKYYVDTSSTHRLERHDVWTAKHSLDQGSPALGPLWSLQVTWKPSRTAVMTWDESLVPSSGKDLNKVFLLSICLLQPISLPGFGQMAEQYGIQILVNSFINYGTDPLGMVILHSIQRILADFCGSAKPPSNNKGTLLIVLKSTWLRRSILMCFQKSLHLTIVLATCFIICSICKYLFSFITLNWLQLVEFYS